jgi:seryl-tRNA synthetase
MIDIELLRNNPDIFRNSQKRRNQDAGVIDAFLATDKLWREKTSESENMRALQKKLGAERKIEEAKALKEKLVVLQNELADLDAKRNAIALSIPNLLADDVPEGKDDAENKVVHTWGEPTKFKFTPLDHMALGTKLGIIDSERAVKVSGSRFTYLKGGMAQLQLALIQFVFTTLTDPKIIKKLAKKAGVSEKVFTPIFPPVMIKPEPYTRMARLSPETKDERYYMPADDMYLIGSAEHTLGSMYMDEIIPEEQLPIRYIGYSTSFRREAGAAGKDTTGILRMHQFDKLEMESFSTAETSVNEQKFFVEIQKYLTEQLGIPYRVVQNCTGDTGTPDARQFDLEMWMPGQNKYRETHSADLMTDYQSRRLGTKYRPSLDSLKANSSKLTATQYVHMNDATAFAIGRTLIAIIENHQTEKGTIKVPKVLQKWAGIKEIR